MKTGAERIADYQESIESLRRHLKHTSWKDNDIRSEIKQEIADLEHWIEQEKKEGGAT